MVTICRTPSFLPVFVPKPESSSIETFHKNNTPLLDPRKGSRTLHLGYESHTVQTGLDDGTRLECVDQRNGYVDQQTKSLVRTIVKSQMVVNLYSYFYIWFAVMLLRIRCCHCKILKKLLQINFDRRRRKTNAWLGSSKSSRN